MRKPIREISFIYEDRKNLADLGFDHQLSEDPANSVVWIQNLPPGWTEQSHDNDTWSELRDTKGRFRGKIITVQYIAYPDRPPSRQCFLERRFQIQIDHAAINQGTIQVRVFDALNQSTVFQTPAEPAEDDLNRTAKVNAHIDQAEAFLRENWPNWDSAAAYWDDDLR